MKEGNYWNRARDQLMGERTEAVRAEQQYLEQMAAELGMKIVPKQLAERAEELKDTLEKLRGEQKRRREVEKALEEAERKAEDTTELKRRLQEAELTVKTFEKKLEAYSAPTPPIITPPPKAAPPIEEITPPARPILEERVVSRECWKLYKKLWNAINNQTAMETSTRVLSGQTGIGTSLISEALSYAKKTNSRKLEDLVDRLLECECLRRIVK